MEPRTKRVVVSLTPSEKKLLIQVAEYEGRLSLTATIRHLIVDAARIRNLPISIMTRPDRLSLPGQDKDI